MDSRNKIVVLGGFGFIGSHLIGCLASRDHQVVAFGRECSVVPDLPWLQRVECCFGDFLSIEDVRKAVTGARVVYHLIGNSAPNSSNENPLLDLSTNVLPTISLLDLCIEEGVEHVVFMSSGGTVYGISSQFPIAENYPTLPICSYGIQKLSIELYMQLYSRLGDIHMTVLRAANPYGPRQLAKRGQGIIGAFCQRIKSGLPLQIWGDGSVIRDYIYIEDLVSAMELVMDLRKGFSVYNLGTGIGTSVTDLVSLIKKIAPNQVELEYFPSRPSDVPINILDSRKIEQEVGWQANWDIRSGLEATLKWHLN